jgi:glutathione S-transferase
MSETTEVRLHGAWGSAHAAMARNALVLKGVQYEYVEEDLDDKSQALLLLNPVHGKVPVLVVDGRLLAESLVIIEYVDEEFHNAVAADFSFAHSLENADGEQVHTIQTNRTSPIPAAQGATSETDQQHQHTTPTPTTRGQGPATTSAQHSLTQV